VTYYLRRDRKNIVHIFNERTCECSGKDTKLPLVAEGIQVRLVTCPTCKRLVSSIVSRELAKLLDEMDSKGITAEY